MHESHFDLTTADGDMPTWIIRPDDGGPHPVVLFLMDAPGMRQEIRDMASRLATAGYYVMTSQLYYRQVREFNVFENGDRDTMFGLMDQLSNSMVDADNGALIAHAAADPAADATRVGVVGYCMSGPFAVTTGAAHNGGGQGRGQLPRCPPGHRRRRLTAQGHRAVRRRGLRRRGRDR